MIKTLKFGAVNGQTEKLTVKILTAVAVVTTGHIGVTPLEMDNLGILQLDLNLKNIPCVHVGQV